MNDWIFLLITKKGAEQLDQANSYCIYMHSGMKLEEIVQNRKIKTILLFFSNSPYFLIINYPLPGRHF